MNLNEINNVQDLLAANAEAPEAPEAPEMPDALKAIFELQPPEALEVIKDAITQMASWHQEQAATADTVKEAHAWAVDEGRLHAALLALNEVEF